MAAAELTIHRLRLGPAPQPVAARLAVQLEDALRTSTKPAALLHRHVLVRFLRLRTPGAASAQALGRQLEQAWQRIAALAQPLDAASDADEAVWAPSEAAARAALVARWARGEAPTAWFWQRIALPAGDAAAQAWPQRALRLMLAPLAVDGPSALATLQTAWSMPDRPAAAPAPALRPVLQALADAGALPRFAAALTAAEAQQLAAVIAAAVPALVQPVPPGGGAAASLHATTLAPTAAAAALAWQALQARLSAWSPSPSAAAAAAATAVPVPDNAVQGLQSAVAPPSAAPVLLRVDASQPVLSAQVGRVDGPRAAAAPPDAIATAWAGLWLLLPVLLRCGLGDDDTPLAAFAQALQAAPDALHVPADDPVRWSIAALDLPSVDTPGPWLRRARLLALRDARLPLRRIASRQGTVHLSDVRLDLVFPARAADVRIRRAGFDLDPGFLPWLGRIVHIHYV